MNKQGIVDRYARKTIKHKYLKHVVHHADCSWFMCSICTCGLLKDLVRLDRGEAMMLYPQFRSELAAQIVTIHKLTRHYC